MLETAQLFGEILIALIVSVIPAVGGGTIALLFIPDKFSAYAQRSTFTLSFSVIYVASVFCLLVWVMQSF